MSTCTWLGNAWLRLIGAAALAVTACAASAADDGFPNRAIRIVVPYSAGGSADAAARVVAQKLTLRLGQPVTVENKAGAGGTVGLRQVFGLPADGYTIALIASGYEWLPAMYARLPFNPNSDFTALALLGSAPYIFITHPNRPFKTVAEFVAHAKVNNGKVSYATAGIGTLHHLLGTLLQAEAGIVMMAIPYGGAAPAEVALLGGQVDVMFDPVGLATVQVKAERARPLATTGSTRAKALPDVPTFSESGIPIRASFWLGLAVRTGVPPAIVSRLNQEINTILQDPEVKQRFDAISLEIDPGPPSKFAAFLEFSSKGWGKVVRDSGIKPE